MYINEVIEMADKYYPSEYERKEMYAWCDEVSAMLMAEDRTMYGAVSYITDENGTVLLPENVDFESILSITVNGKTIKKENIARCGDRRIKATALTPMCIVYLIPYAPIRDIVYCGEARFENADKKIILGKNLFIKGDMINIKVNGTDYGAAIVLETGGELNSENFLRIDGDVKGFNAEDTVIERVITDKTVCNAPYDRMYIDYILARIGMYQKDYEMYNQYMTVFNSRLSAYKRWLINHIPQMGGKFINWW